MIKQYLVKEINGVVYLVDPAGHNLTPDKLVLWTGDHAGLVRLGERRSKGDSCKGDWRTIGETINSHNALSPELLYRIIASDSEEVPAALLNKSFADEWKELGKPESVYVGFNDGIYWISSPGIKKVYHVTITITEKNGLDSFVRKTIVNHPDEVTSVTELACLHVQKKNLFGEYVVHVDTNEIRKPD